MHIYFVFTKIIRDVKLFIFPLTTADDRFICRRSLEFPKQNDQTIARDFCQIAEENGRKIKKKK